MYYKVAVTWEMYGTLDIEANSWQEALEIANKTQDDLPLPDDKTYVDASFRIDAESTQAINEYKEDK